MPKVVSGVTEITFSYYVENTGDMALTVDVTDDIYGSIATGYALAAGDSVTFYHGPVTITTADPSQTNEATAHGTGQSGADVSDTDSHTVTVLHPAIAITKTGTPAEQLAPGEITWEIVVTNTGDVPLTNVDVSDTRYGTLESGITLDVSESRTYSYVESGLPPGTYTNVATATGQHQLGSVSATDDAECVVNPVYILKQFTAVGTLLGGDAELVNETHVAVYGLKTGPTVYFTVTYYFENSLNFLGDDYDGQAHNFTLWDKWGGNLLALGSPPDSFSLPDNLTLADGNSFSINPRDTGADSYRGYIGDGLDISNLASQGEAWITMHLGDQQNMTNPGEGEGTSKDSTSYDTDVVWYIGELADGQSATLTLYIAPGMNPGRQLEFTSTGCKVINTGPRVRAYGATYENEDFLYAGERTNTLTVCVYPSR